MTVGERIRQRRIELGMSQQELAEAVGYHSRSSINKIELSRILPLKKVERVAEALKCSPTYLMGWDDEENKPKPLAEKIPDHEKPIAPLPQMFYEELSKAEFELVDYFRHCDMWGKRGITETAKREFKRCQADIEHNKFRGRGGYDR